MKKVMLLRCPFCGNHGEMYKELAGCKKCDTWLDSVEEWNTRSGYPDPIKDTRERAISDLQRLLERLDTESDLYVESFTKEALIVEAEPPSNWLQWALTGEERFTICVRKLRDWGKPRSEVISEPDAAIKVEQYNLTDGEREGLTINVDLGKVKL